MYVGGVYGFRVCWGFGVRAWFAVGVQGLGGLGIRLWGLRAWLRGVHSLMQGVGLQDL